MLPELHGSSLLVILSIFNACEDHPLESLLVGARRVCELDHELSSSWKCGAKLGHEGKDLFLTNSSQANMNWFGISL